uniref:Uncharacterized protein n=1 Tax=Anguilla anguilla TaxID=7936 RepID=A0A0E9TAQ0_ANGAN
MSIISIAYGSIWRFCPIKIWINKLQCTGPSHHSAV